MIKKVFIKLTFSFSTLKIPIVDVDPFLKGKDNCTQECKIVADSLHKFGCLIIKDPRVNHQQNNVFLDMMETYFSKRSKDFYAGRKVQDIYPDYDFEVGVTPQFTERARIHEALIKTYTLQNKVITPIPPPFDAKWRYFWNIGTPKDTFQNQTPKDFSQWEVTMNSWGNHMIDGCTTVTEMAAIGMGLERDVFTKLMIDGPHKLAPTGSDLVKYDVGTIFAGFHYDFNFLTIHGKARYPGLFAWLKTGQKFTVDVPEGHLLLQAGRQFEYLTGGYISTGFHEVIYTEAVKQAKQKAIMQGRIPWRVSSTLFSHIRYGEILRPLGNFATPQTNVNYPAIESKEFAYNQLDTIKLNV